MTDIVRNGKFETDVAVEENKNYVAVAFGYNVAASEFLTQFFRAEIKNGGDEPGMSEAWVNMACVYGTISGQPESEPSSIRMIKPLRSKPADLRSRDLRPLWRRLV